MYVRLSIFCMFGALGQVFGWTSLMKHDPIYLFSTQPHAYLMLESAKVGLYDCCCDTKQDFTTFAITPYYQKARRGRNYQRERVPLGDLEGRWHILGMIYGDKPSTGRPPLGNQILKARMAIYGNTDTPNELNVDPKKEFGYYSVPLDYRKAGARFEWSFNPVCDFGFTILGGVTDIKQTTTFACRFVNLDPDPNGSQDELIKDRTKFTQSQLENARCFVTTESAAKTILHEQGYDLCDYQKTTVEDIHFRVWWRHPFRMNKDLDPYHWPQFIFTPYAAFQASIDVAQRIDRKFNKEERDGTKIFSLSTGNDGHHAVGFTAGFLIDFDETVEIGIEGGFMHFFSRDITDFRIPTSKVQSGVFPCVTDVKREPGRNYHFRATLHANCFLDHLSASVEYVFADHSEDRIKLKEEDPNFFPWEIECKSKWMSQVLVTSLNYDISPNAGIGFALQWPLMQRNSYRTTTVAGTVRFTF